MATHGAPRIGQGLSLRDELNAPGPEILGTIPTSLTDPTPLQAQGAWQTPDGKQVDVVEAPPPWELEDKKYSASDARRYVDVPSAWTIRWANPKLIEQNGWNYWNPVLPSDPRVHLKVMQMQAPDGTIRRGGATGDVLAYMPTNWVVSRRKQLQEETAKQTQSAVDRLETLKDEFRRGKYGPNVRLEEARHPSHTMAEGASMRD